jgi:hypothetical protein
MPTFCQRTQSACSILQPDVCVSACPFDGGRYCSLGDVASSVGERGSLGGGDLLCRGVHIHTHTHTLGGPVVTGVRLTSTLFCFKTVDALLVKHLRVWCCKCCDS